jgi:hypothetical protein
MGFILLTAYAESFMGERVYEGLTVGYCLALTQFLMVVVLGLGYLRRASKVFDPLAEKAVQRYAHASETGTDDGRGRFARASEQEAVGSRSATATEETTR